MPGNGGNGTGRGTGEVRVVQVPLQQGLLKVHCSNSPAHAGVGTGVVVAPGVVVPRGVTVMLPVAVGVVEAAVTDGVPLPPGKVKSSSPQPTASTTANAAAAESNARKARRFRLTLPEERSMPAVSDGRARGLLAELLGDAHPILMGATLLAVRADAACAAWPCAYGVAESPCCASPLPWNPPGAAPYRNPRRRSKGGDVCSRRWLGVLET